MSALLALPLFEACQTAGFQPIEIDLSNRTPAAESPTPTAVAPSPTATRTALPPTPVGRVESAPVATPPPPTPIPSASTPVAGARSLEAVVDEQNAAFNRHDLGALVSVYSLDAVFYEYPDRVRHSGLDEIRRSYGKGFAESPSLAVKVSRRLVQGSYVIDQETLSGLPGGGSMVVVAIYEIRDGRIVRVWYLQ